MEEAGRGGRTDARNSELAAGAEKAAVKAAEKIAREASADGKLDNTEKSEAKKAAEKAAKDKVKEAENANAGTGEVVVQQGDTVWGALRNAGYSDADIVSKGLVNQVAQASGLQPIVATLFSINPCCAGTLSTFKKLHCQSDGEIQRERVP